MTIKSVMRYSPAERLLRLFRIIWVRGQPGVGGFGDYSAKVSIGLRPRLWSWEHEWDGWRLAAAGVHVSYRRSWGGIFA
jgi:hypothetical protein